MGKRSEEDKDVPKIVACKKTRRQANGSGQRGRFSIITDPQPLRLRLERCLWHLGSTAPDLPCRGLGATDQQGNF